MAELTHRQYKQLRDMADGHLNLYATVYRYDPITGQQLDQPVVAYFGHDRPDIIDRDWWRPLLAAGLIALPADHDARCYVTLDGHTAVRAYELKEADRG